MNDDRGISNGGGNPALQRRGALECDNDGTRVRVGADVNHLETRYVNSKVNADEPLHYVSQLEIDQNRLLLNNKIGGKCRGWVGKSRAEWYHALVAQDDAALQQPCSFPDANA